MILIEDIKYSCIECIRGHRSTLCKHHNRPLVQVRSKGRPNVSVNGNPNHRIVVFVENIKPSEKDLIVLKASPKQVMDIKSGKILGPYHENSTQNYRPPPPVINSDSFINTSSCGCEITKVQKSCGCCNKLKKPNKSKILSTYLSKKLQNSKDDPNLNHIRLQDIQDRFRSSTKHKDFPTDNTPTEPSTGRDNILNNFPLQFIPQEFQYNCTIAGTCVCGPECACPGCKVHENPANYELDYQQTQDSFNNLGLQNHTEPSLMTAPAPVPQTQTIPINHMPVPFDHSILNNAQEPYPEQNNIYSQQTESPSSNGACSCPDNNCDCTNCETHGIINGFKLDDFFSSNNSKLWSVMAEFPELGGVSNTQMNNQGLNTTFGACGGASQQLPSTMSSTTGSCSSSSSTTTTQQPINSNGFCCETKPATQTQQSSKSSCCSKPETFAAPPPSSSCCSKNQVKTEASTTDQFP